MLLKDKLSRYSLVLASKSPRRQQLLAELGLSFEVRIGDTDDESFPSSLLPHDVPSYLAQKKASVLIDGLSPNEILITSDTIVICENQILGKPSSRSEAISTLKMLSGKPHVVVTGVSLSSVDKQKTFSVSTKVYFRNLTPEEIEFYVDTYKPFDKAGSYGVQEWIGYVGVERIEGSYFNVMGLPVQVLYHELNHFVDSLYVVTSQT